MEGIHTEEVVQIHPTNYAVIHQAHILPLLLPIVGVEVGRVLPGLHLLKLDLLLLYRRRKKYFSVI